MKKWLVLLFMILATSVFGADVSGRIMRVDKLRSTFLLRPDNGKPIQITVSRGADIRFSSGGIPRTVFKELKPGMKVKVTHQSGTASRIVIQ